jgi:hypothetical protein
MELDETIWRMFKDSNRVVEDTVKEALQQIGWSVPFKTQIALRRGSGSAPADCIEVWCVALDGVEPEIRHCRAVHDKHDDMVKKFARSLEALRA